MLYKLWCVIHCVVCTCMDVSVPVCVVCICVHECMHVYLCVQVCMCVEGIFSAGIC